jgi:2-phosphoglycerate kinase
MRDGLRVILIGGTSNIGKSTVARHIAQRLGWEELSTDRLGRYPGRPWATPPDVVKPHVVEHYLTHDAPALVLGQLEHYRQMWPKVEEAVRAHLLDDSSPLVLEGSGVWPDNVAALGLPAVAAVWLTGSPELIAARIRRESRYEEADEQGRLLIDRFVMRSQGYDIEMRAALQKYGLPLIEVTPDTTVEALGEASLETMRPLG